MTDETTGGGAPAEARSEPNPAPNSQTLSEARDALSRICKLLGVTKAIVVDDAFSVEPSVDDFVTRVRGLHANDPGTVTSRAEFTGLDWSDGIESSRQDLERLWNERTVQQQAALFLSLGGTKLEPALSSLTDLFQGVPLERLSLKGWREMLARGGIAGVAAESLFLFDLDMSPEGGATDEGLRLISELLKDTQGVRYCGLLSHNVSIEKEFAYWEECCKTHGLADKRDKFAVVSKAHLPDDPGMFAQRLKRIAIAPACEELRRQVESVLDEAFREAKSAITELNLYDLEQIVFQSSHVEGVWEPDTMMRLLGLHVQRHARRLLKANTDAEQAAAKVREVIDIDFRPSDAPTPSARKLLFMENYEDGTFLADHRIPLDCGDIFRKLKCGKKSDAGDEFIVIAQSCDIMCRNEPGPRRHEVHLAPIVKRKRDKDRSRACVEPRYFELIAYRDDPTAAWCVDLGKAVAVPICALDLAVFNAEGNASIAVDDTCPTQVIPAWRRRHGELVKEAGTLLTRYDASTRSTSGESRELVEKALTQSVRGVLTGHIDVSRRSISYDVYRVARLKQPRASALLRAFAAYHARDGFDHDFSRTMPSSAK